MTLTHDNPADDFGDADWLAFAYVAGELAETELTAWEARLAEGDVEALLKAAQRSLSHLRQPTCLFARILKILIYGRQGLKRLAM